MKAARAKRVSDSSPRPLEERRDEILDAAIRLFARQGFADTDLQVLADQLGIGKGSLYRHFGNKEQLFLAAADRVMRKLLRHIDASVEGIDDPLQRIAGAIHAYVEYFATNSDAVEMMIQERAHFKDRKRPTYFEHREANVERWRDLYRQLSRAGRIRPLSAERLSDAIGNWLYGTMFVNYIAGRKRPPAQVAGEIVDLFFHGILTAAERQALAEARPPAPGNGAAPPAVRKKPPA